MVTDAWPANSKETASNTTPEPVSDVRFSESKIRDIKRAAGEHAQDIQRMAKGADLRIIEGRAQAIVSLVAGFAPWEPVADQERTPEMVVRNENFPITPEVLQVYRDRVDTIRRDIETTRSSIEENAKPIVIASQREANLPHQGADLEDMRALAQYILGLIRDIRKMEDRIAGIEQFLAENKA